MSQQPHLLAIQLTQAENRERRRLAMLLHDGLQQLLIAARMKTGALEQKLRGDSNSTLARQVIELLEEAIAASRSLSVELSPPMLYDAGLGAALEWLSCQMEEKHGLRVALAVSDEPEDEDIRVFLFQCIRELLFNTVKHAEVSFARITMCPAEHDCLCVTVSDEGHGFSPAGVWENWQHGDSFGLRSIFERMALLGGRFDLDSAPGRGTRATLTVPRRKPASCPVNPTAAANTLKA